MKLFKAYNADVTCKDDLVVTFATNEMDATERVIDKACTSFYFGDWLFENLTVNELMNEIEGNEHLLQLLMIDDKEQFVREVFRVTDLKHWTIEEVELENETVFACYPEDIDSIDDFELVFADKGATESDVLDILAMKECKSDNFREYIQCKSVNMSFSERFYIDEIDYMFAPDMPFRSRDDIAARFGYDNKKINAYLDSFWANKANKFFGDKPVYAEMFKKYITTDASPDILSQDFYYFCCRKLLSERDWIGYEIEQVTI